MVQFKYFESKDSSSELHVTALLSPFVGMSWAILFHSATAQHNPTNACWSPPEQIMNRGAEAGMAVWKEGISHAGFVVGDIVMSNYTLISFT